MKGTNPNDTRQHIQATMLSFIYEPSPYSIQDIVTVINEPSPLLESILEGNVSQIEQSKMDLVKLYAIALKFYSKMPILMQKIIMLYIPMLPKLNNSHYFNHDTEGDETFIRSILEHQNYYLFASSNYQKKTHFNPLKLPDTLKNRQFNTELLKQLCKNQENDDLDAIIVEQLKDCVDYAYKQLPQYYRTLSNATKILPKHFSRWVELRRWLRSDGKCPEGNYAYIFDNKDDEFDLEIRGSFNLHHFFDREPQHIQTPVAMYLLYKIDLAFNGAHLNKTLH